MATEYIDNQQQPHEREITQDRKANILYQSAKELLIHGHIARRYRGAAGGEDLCLLA
jgi:hypothetical protein